jgi:VWFA-related protein
MPLTHQMKAAAALVAALAAPGFVTPPQGFRSSIDMVAVYPLVSGPDGRLVTDLNQRDFEVFDNGTPAEISIFSSDRQPMTALLLLDMSASMEDRWMRVRDAAVRFVDAIEPVDRLRIGTFGSEIALSPHLTGDKILLTRVLREELWPGGSTPLWQAMSAGMSSIASQSGRRTIVIVTDGVDTSNVSHTAVVDRAIKEQFMIYGIGFEGKGLGARLINLIGQTGGGHFDLKRGDDLGMAFLRLADELRHQYLIGFTPALLDGRTHALEIRVNRPGYTVRAPRQFVATVKK